MRDIDPTVKVYAAICGKVQVDDRFQVLLNRLDATNLSGHIHGVPDLMQLDTFGMFHYDILAANWILSIIRPVQYSRYWDVSSRLY